MIINTEHETEYSLPESSEEFVIGNVTISIDVVVLHQGLQLNFLGEKSKQREK